MIWHQTAPPTDLDVACSGARHQLRWAENGVELLDHPELDAERALMALGGAEPACLALLTLWQEAIDDGGFLAEWADEAHLSNARLSWLTMALERMRTEGYHEFLRDLPPKRAERMGQFLSRFPRPWHDRAAATVAEAIVDGAGVGCGQAPRLLTVAIANRLRRAFVTSVGSATLSLGAAALVPLDLTVTSDRPVQVTGRLRGPDRGVSIVVAPGWLHQVWAAGAAVIDGHLVVSACAQGPQTSTPRLRVTTVEWDDNNPSTTPRLRPREAVLGDRTWTLLPSSLIEFDEGLGH